MEIQEKSHISIRVPERLWDNFKAKAEANHCHASEVLRQFMREYTTEQEKAIQELPAPVEDIAQEHPQNIIEWVEGDWFEDVEGRRGWVKTITGQMATCIVYGSMPRCESLKLADLVEKITVPI